MQWQYVFYLFFFLVLWCPWVSHAQQDDTLKSTNTTLQITSTTLGPSPEPLYATIFFEWKVIVRWYGQLNEINPELINNPIPEEIEILNQALSLRMATEEERRFAEKTFTFTLQAEEPGTYTFKEAEITYVMPGETQVNHLRTAAQSFEIQPAPFDLRQFLWNLWNDYFVVWIVLIFLALLGLCVTLYHKGRKPSDGEAEALAPKADPVATAFERAHRARVEGDLYQYVNCLKQAIQIQFGVDESQTFDQDTQQFRERLVPSLQETFDRFLRLTEEAKYSPAVHSQDLWERLWNDAKQITKSKESP